MCASVKDAACNYLWPLQVGVAHPLGADVRIQVARQCCLRHSSDPDAVFLNLDFSNAFNTVDRETILREVCCHMPGLAAFTDFCYARPSKLVFGSRTLISASGVQ